MGGVTTTTPKQRAYSARKYQMTISVFDIMVSMDPKGRTRCDFWGRVSSRDGLTKSIRCVAIGPNYDRLRAHLINGNTIKAVGVYETARQPAGMMKPFHLITATGTSVALPVANSRHSPITVLAAA